MRCYAILCPVRFLEASAKDSLVHADLEGQTKWQSILDNVRSTYHTLAMIYNH